MPDKRGHTHTHSTHASQSGSLAGPQVKEKKKVEIRSSEGEREMEKTQIEKFRPGERKRWRGDYLPSSSWIIYHQFEREVR